MQKYKYVLRMSLLFGVSTMHAEITESAELIHKHSRPLPMLGDVIGYTNSSQVAFVGGISAADLVAKYNAPTASGTCAADPNSLVERDAQGSALFTALGIGSLGAIKAPSTTEFYAGNNVGSSVTICATTRAPSLTSNSTAFGTNCLSVNTLGTDNTAIGYNALAANTDSQNTAIGSGALASIVSGKFNTAVGYNAMSSGTAINSTAVGANSSISANNGVAVGVSAQSTGLDGVAIGMSATASNFGVAVGQTAHATGSRSIALGQGVTATNDNDIAIGTGSIAGTAGSIFIGTNTFHTSCFIQGIRGVTTGLNDAVAVLIDSAGQLGTVSSSRRYKKDIQPMGDKSADIMKLRPVTFKYKTHAQSDRCQYGLIAEEVNEIYPDLVVRNKDNEIETVAYQHLPILMLNEMQKQHKKIEMLEQAIKDLMAVNEMLSDRLDAIEA